MKILFLNQPVGGVIADNATGQLITTQGSFATS